MADNVSDKTFRVASQKTPEYQFRIAGIYHAHGNIDWGRYHHAARGGISFQSLCQTLLL